MYIYGKHTVDIGNGIIPKKLEGDRSCSNAAACNGAEAGEGDGVRLRAARITADKTLIKVLIGRLSRFL